MQSPAVVPESATGRSLRIDYFEPDISEFRLISDERLRASETTLLAAIRKMFPDAVVGEKGGGRLFVLSESSSLAFEIPAFF